MQPRVDDSASLLWPQAFSVTTVGWKEVMPNGEPSSLSAAIDRLKRYSLLQLCMMVSRISVVLHNRPAVALRDTQDRLIDNHLGNGVARRLRERVRLSQEVDNKNDDVVFFSERQLLNAVKLAFLSVPLSAPNTRETAHRFVEALLMISDLIDERELGQTPTDDRAAVELGVFANILFNQQAGTLYDYVRSYSLFIDPNKQIVSQPGAANIRVMFERATGFPPEKGWALLNAIASGWIAKSDDELERGDLFRSRSTFLSSLSGLSRPEAEHAFEKVCWNAPELQLAVQDRYAGGMDSTDALRSYDFLPFEQRPIVAFNDEATCVAMPLLHRLTTVSLEHRFLDPDLFSKSERWAFLKTRGDLFERYVIDAFRRAFGSRFLSGDEIRPFAGASQHCDGVIVYPDAAILIEAKAAMVRLEARYRESYDAYRDTLRKATQAAAAQLEATATLIATGALRSLGIEPAIVHEIYPVIVLFEQVITPLAYRSIHDEYLKGHPLVARVESGLAMPIQLIDVREVEMWEIAAESGRSIRDLLAEKVRDISSREMAFHQFCYLRHEAFLNRRGDWYAQRYTEIMGEVRRQLLELGMTRTDS